MENVPLILDQDTGVENTIWHIATGVYNDARFISMCGCPIKSPIKGALTYKETKLFSATCPICSHCAKRFKRGEGRQGCLKSKPIL